MYLLRSLWLIFPLLAGFVQASAQTYPVRASVFLAPPYSVYLTDYTRPEAERLTAQIYLADLARPELAVRLRITIQGQGVRLQTSPTFNPEPLYLQGGVPVRFGAVELMPYLQPENLVFQGISQSQFMREGQKLPEGLYTFTIEVLEYNRQVKISNSAAAMAWLVLNDPPMLSFPGAGEKARISEPQNLVFQWTPRHTGSPNSAFTTEYEFSLVEIWPEGRDPNEAMRTTQPIYTEVTTRTQFVYGPSAPMLEPGRRYAWRVQARSAAGGSDLSLFKNGGYSEVRSFQWGDACLGVQDLQLEARSGGQIFLSWQGQTNHTGYTVRYRPQQEDGKGDWFEESSLLPELTLKELQPATRYEFSVLGSCGFLESLEALSDTLSTLPYQEPVFACGLPAQGLDLSNEVLLNQLKNGDMIYAGDFNVRLTEVSGTGTFTGKGLVEVPFMNKAKVAVVFTDIQVNEDHRLVAGHMSLIGGKLEIVPQEVLDAIDRLDETLENIDGVLAQVDAGINLTNDIIEKVGELANEILDNGPFTREEEIRYANATVAEYIEAAKDNVATATDQLASASTPEEYAAAARNVAQAIALKQRADQLQKIYSSADTVKVIAVDFIGADKWGFDAQTHEAHRLHYNVLVTPDKQTHGIPWISTLAGQQNTAKARFITTSGLAAENIIFKAGEEELSATRTGDGWTVDLPEVPKGQEKSVQAIDKTTGDLVGKLFVIGYEQLDRTVNIVTVNGATLGSLTPEQIQTELNRIYGQAVANWKVNALEALTIDGFNGTLQDDEQALLSTYSTGMKSIIKAFQNRGDYNKDEFYLFVVANSQTNKSGYMPRKHRYGFIYANGGGNKAQTIAHELGHGAFRLQHTFEEYPTIAEQTQNLMDYGSGTVLRKYQWDMIHNPPVVIGLVEDENEGSIAGVNCFTPKWEVFSLPVEVSQTVLNTGDSRVPKGTVPGFVLTNGKKYSAKFDAAGNFTGYYNTGDTIYTLTPIKSLKSADKVYIFEFNGDCSLNKYYASTYGAVTASDYFKTGNNTLSFFASLGQGQLIPCAININDLCDYGKRFYATYSGGNYSTDQLSYIKSTAKLICEYPEKALTEAFSATNDEVFKEKLETWLMWGSDKARLQEARQAFWLRPDAWKIYYEKLYVFTKNYEQLKSLIDKGDLSNSFVKAIVSANTPEFLALYTVEQRLDLIKEILPEDDEMFTASGDINWSNIYVSNGEENALIKLFQSFRTADDATKLLTALTDNSLIKVLNDHIDDFGFGGNNYTNLAKEFQRLVMLKSGIPNGPQAVHDYVIQQAKANQAPYYLLWNDNSLFFPDNKNGVVVYNEIDISGDDLKIKYSIKENCRTVAEQIYYNGSAKTVYKTVCDQTTPQTIDLKYFEPVIITIAGDFSDQLPADFTSVAANGFVTYGGFIECLDRKKGTQQALTIADYTLTTASLALGVGEVFLIVRAGATAGRVAIVSWELGSEIVDLTLQSEAFEQWCAENPSACNKIQTANLINQIASFGPGAFDIAMNWSAIKNGVRSTDAGSNAGRGFSLARFRDSATELIKDPKLADEAFELFKNEKWSELQLFVKNININGGVWPPAYGFSKISEVKKSLQIGTTQRFDRFQSESSLGGGFASPIYPSENIGDLHFTYDSRMLNNDLQEGTYYFEFSFSDKVEDFNVTYGDVMPWFNHVDAKDLAGQQVMFDKRLHTLNKDNFNRVNAQVRYNGDWRKCVVDGKEVVVELQNKINKLDKDLANKLVDYINSSSNNLALFKNNPDLQDDLIESWRQLNKTSNQVPNCQ